MGTECTGGDTQKGWLSFQCGKGNQRLIKVSLTPSQYTLMGQQEP